MIKYGLEPAVFVDSLSIAIDPGVDTPEEYIIHAPPHTPPTVESSESPLLMGLDGCRTEREQSGAADVRATLRTKGSGLGREQHQAFICKHKGNCGADAL